MDALPSLSHQINITCNDNKNDGGTQTIIGLNTKNVNNYYPVVPQTGPVPTQVPFPPQDTVVGDVSYNIEVVLNWLQDPSFHPIGVWGMGGVGKTMLLKAIFNKLYADPSIAGSAYWVNVSQSCNLYQLQEKIARAINLDFCGEESEHRRAALLHHKLGQMERVVLILDDVWDCFTADQIQDPRGENGFKMIFSTRSKALCRRMGHAEYALEVQPLTEGEALKLFRSTLENYDELSDDVQKIALLVSKECGRLPLVIKVIAASLKGEYDFHTWQYTLQQLRDLDIGHKDMEKQVYRILRISYDRLKGEELKSCFLNCVLYPEDYEIMIEELIDLLIMEGSLDHIKQRAMQISKGYSILNELVNSCLLEPCDISGRELGVKMHDLMREMAINITTKEHPRFLVKCCLHLENFPAQEVWNKDLVKASLSRNKIQEIPRDMSPETPNLTVLLMDINSCLEEIPASFFVQMKSLRVLDLSFTQIKRLPNSVSDLEDLRMLLLVGCTELKHVPSLTKLSKLLVLGLPYPGCEGKWGLEELTRGMERMKSLEKLTYCQWKTSEVIRYNNFIESAQFLTYYTLGLVDEDFHLLNFSPARMFDLLNFSPARRFDEMYYDRLFFITGGKFRGDKVTPQIPRKAQWVSFRNMEITRVDNLVDALPSFAELEELKSFGIYNCGGLEYIATSLAQGKYPSTSQLGTLEELFLEKLPNLIRMTKDGAYCFSHLTKLIISDCPRLEVGLPIKSASNLEIVDVKNCKELKEIFETNDVSSSSTAIIALSKLKILNLDDLPKLSSIYRGLLLCTALKHKMFFDCPQLNLLPLSEPMICNDSPASRASIPNKKDNPEWWEPLIQNYPEDANTLSRFKAFGSVDQESHSDDDEGISPVLRALASLCHRMS